MAANFNRDVPASFSYLLRWVSLVAAFILLMVSVSAAWAQPQEPPPDEEQQQPQEQPAPGEGEQEPAQEPAQEPEQPPAETPPAPDEGEAPPDGEDEDEWLIDQPPAESDRGLDFSLGVGLTPRPYGLGGILRVGVPIVDQGLFRELNDALFLELGGGANIGIKPGDYWTTSVSDWDVVWSVKLPVMVRWNFYINQAWTVFASFGPTWELALYDRANPLLTAIPTLGGGFGTVYSLAGNLGLRLDVNSDLIAIGLSWGL